MNTFSELKKNNPEFYLLKLVGAFKGVGALLEVLVDATDISTFAKQKSKNCFVIFRCFRRVYFCDENTKNIVT